MPKLKRAQGAQNVEQKSLLRSKLFLLGTVDSLCRMRKRPKTRKIIENKKPAYRVSISIVFNITHHPTTSPIPVVIRNIVRSTRTVKIEAVVDNRV